MLQLLYPLLQIHFLLHERCETALKPQQQVRARQRSDRRPPPFLDPTGGDPLTCSLSMATWRAWWVSAGTLSPRVPEAGTSFSAPSWAGAAR